MNENNIISLAKPTNPINPKDAMGIRKPPSSCIPAAVIQHVGIAMLEGARRYGRHNYREAGVMASIYYDAARRHMDEFWEYGLDKDPDSPLHPVVKAIASLVVLYDGILMGNVNDDRPPPIPVEVYESLKAMSGQIIDAIPEPKPPVTRLSLERKKQ